MLNDFLSDILKVIIVLDVLGVIAYFLLGLKAKKADPVAGRTEPVPEEVTVVEDGELFGPGFINPAVAAARSPSPLPAPAKSNLWTRVRRALPRRGRSLRARHTGNLEEAMMRLRRVLSSYESDLST